MAQFELCYAFIMGNEDGPPPWKYEEVTDLPPGAHAISGINSAAFPAQFASIAALAQAERGAAVEAFYRYTLWNDWLGSLVSDELGKRVFDATVNPSGPKAVGMLQKALNSLGGGSPLAEDGLWGPITLARANQALSNELVVAFKAQRRAHYLAFDADSPYLPQLLARAAK
jgi:lysozyme family protein